MPESDADLLAATTPGAAASSPARPAADTAPVAPTAAPVAPTAAPAPHPLLRRTFASLHHRDFRIFYVGQLISVTGTWMQSVAQGWLVLILTGSPFLLGVTSAARSLPVLFLSFVGGVAADRWDRRRIIIASNAAAMALSTVLTFLTATGRIDVAGILVLAFCLGITNAFEMPARQAYVVELVGPHHLMNAIALNSLLFNSARVVGPAIAGVLVAAFGPAVVFGLNAISFVPVIAGLLLIQAPSTARAAVQARGALGEAVRYLKQETRVAILLALLSANTVFATGYLVLTPVIARDLRQGAEGLGLLVAATGLGAMIAGVVLAAGGARDRWGWLLLAAGLTTSASLIGVALSGSFALTVLLFAGAGWGMVTYTATSNTLIQSIVPDSLRGRIMSVYTITMLGFVPAASLLAGTLADLFGTPVALGTGAMIWGAVLVGAFGASSRLRHL